MGISLTAVFASAGLVGLALALAARETIANFFGGINILIDRPFRTGDYIILDSGERGEVIEVGLRSTRINTRDDVQISIPNSVITDAKIINENVPENRFRVRIKIDVARMWTRLRGYCCRQPNRINWLAQCLSPVSDFVPLGNLPWNLNCCAGPTSLISRES